MGTIGNFDVFDVFVHVYDEAGEDAFGHEAGVFVTEDEVIFGVPVISGRVGAEEVGGDVFAGVFWDFVADFEFFHELEELGLEASVLFVAPDVAEVFVGELAEVSADTIVVEDFVAGGGAPVGF